MIVHIVFDEFANNLKGFRSRNAALEKIKGQRDITVVSTTIKAESKEEYLAYVAHESTRLDRLGRPVTYLEVV